MSPEADNLRKFAHECKGLLRTDILEAMEDGAKEIERLQEVVRSYQQRVRLLKSMT